MAASDTGTGSHAPIPRSLLLMVCGLAAAYGTYAVLRHWHFQSNAYDLGIFDQIVWRYSRFERPASSLRGLPNMLADHFHPILMVLAPLYWIASRPEMLLIAQAALLALSVVPVFLYARDRLGEGLAFALAAAYALFWGIQKAVAFDFHEVAFAPVLIATAVLAMSRRRWPLFWTAAGGLLLVKEDMPLVVAACGAYLLLRGERGRGLAALGLGLAVFLVLVKVILPGMGGTATYEYGSAYASLGGDPLRLPLRALTDPLAVLRTLVTPLAKVRTLALWLGPFLFLPLLSPLALVAVPVVLALLLSASPLHWMPHFHYSAPLAPVLAMAAADGMARLQARLGPSRGRRLGRIAIVPMVLMCAILPGKLPIWRLLSPAYYRFSDSERTGHRLVASIPPAASVVAQSAIAPHLSQRERIHVLAPGAPEADFVLAGAGLSTWPNRDFGEVEGLLRERMARGYTVTAREAGWVVLRR